MEATTSSPLACFAHGESVKWKIWLQIARPRNLQVALQAYRHGLIIRGYKLQCRHGAKACKPKIGGCTCQRSICAG